MQVSVNLTECHPKLNYYFCLIIKREQDWPSLWWKKVDCTCKEYVVYNKTVDLVNYDLQPNVVVTPIQALVARKMDSALPGYWSLSVTWCSEKSILRYLFDPELSSECHYQPFEQPGIGTWTHEKLFAHNNVNNLIFTGQGCFKK